MPDAEKATEMLKVFVGERLLREIDRLARADHRKTSEYVRLLLLHHVYGHGSAGADAEVAEE